MPCKWKANPEEVFSEVEALYSTLLSGRGALRVRRAKINTSGEVQCEPLDFLWDVEIRAKEILDPLDYAMFLRLSYQEQPELIPAHIKEALGIIFDANGLGITGAYRSLYFRIKNQNMREAMHEREQFGTEPNQFD
jgi:hypothetical protein